MDVVVAVAVTVIGLVPVRRRRAAGAIAAAACELMLDHLPLDSGAMVS